MQNINGEYNINALPHLKKELERIESEIRTINEFIKIAKMHGEDTSTYESALMQAEQEKRDCEYNIGMSQAKMDSTLKALRRNHEIELYVNRFSRMSQYIYKAETISAPQIRRG